MKAMILAAGRGTRMDPITVTTPKPLVKLKNRYLIEYVFDNLIKAGITEVVINIHHLSSKIKDCLKNGANWGINISYSEESELLDTGGGILNAIQQNLLGQEPFIVISADIVTLFDLSTLMTTPTLFDLTTLTSPIAACNGESSEASSESSSRYSLNMMPQSDQGFSQNILNNLAHLVLVPNPKFKPDGDFCLNPNGVIGFKQPQQPNYTYANIGIFNPKFFTDPKPKSKTFPLLQLLQQHIINQQITGEIYHGVWNNIGSLQDLNWMENNYKILS